MLKKLMDLLGDRTVSSLLLSIAGLVVIMTFTRLKQPRGHHETK